MLKHWVIKDINPLNMVVLESPTMMEDRDGTKIFTDFSTKRQLYSQFKQMEKSIRKAGMRGWIGNTEIGHTSFIRMIVKCGGQPYWIDLKTNLIWFMKDFNREEK